MGRRERLELTPPRPAPELCRPLGSLRATDMPIAGGKGANLGELIAGGFPVPDGFVLTTLAYELIAKKANVDPADPHAAAERLRTVHLPEKVATTLVDGYRALGSVPVAVRSSATAEDLPGASFAGQQDTFLDVEGEDHLVDAVRACWASLWNDRAVAYRRANGIDDRTVALAVVVQRMVEAVAAGVAFTADPITGRRHRVVIDAAPGLGEALVAGRVDPDHYVVDPVTGEVLDQAVKDERPVLVDDLVRQLAGLGERIELHLGAPQDIEFAVDEPGRVWIVQSRPITTLYPLPEGMPDPTIDLRVLFSGNVFQGYFDPITPMGIEPFRILGELIEGAFGRPPPRATDRDRVHRLVVEAGMRIYLDVTPLLRDRVGRVLVDRFTALGEARSSVVLRQLTADPRIGRPAGSRPSSLRQMVRLLRSGIPLSILRLLHSPDRVRDRLLREVEELSRFDVPPGASANDRLDLFEHRLRTVPPMIAPRVLPIVGAGVFSFAAAGRLLGDRARPDELQTLTRGLPHNPTTEMDLALWAVAADLRRDPSCRGPLLDDDPSTLASRYVAGELPRRFQQGLATFLDRYGFRSVGEIDLGLRRWREDPAHIIGALANYVRLEDDALAPDSQFARGAREADAMMQALLGRVHGPKRRLLRFFLRRVRALMGAREQPKFNLIRWLFTPLRELIRPVGVGLASVGRLAAADDVFFLTLDEARRAVAGDDLRETALAHRASYERERTRRHIPRVLLSDGTDAEIALVAPDDSGLRGTPASPGQVTGTARVILSPRGARLDPGEILVAPSTDPGWTPLFLTAGGLVMEMGGMMSHGAVVAREYGIPAVVGVPGATDRIATGQRVTVDGSAGIVTPEAS